MKKQEPEVAKEKKDVLLNIDLYHLRNAFNNIVDASKDKYPIHMNLELIAPYIKSLNATIERTDDYKKYINELNVLHAKYCKCEDGRPVYYNPSNGERGFDLEIGQPIYVRQEETCKAEEDKLYKKYKDILVARQEQMDAFNNKLKEPVMPEIILVKIDIERLPEMTYQGSYVDFRALMKIKKD